MGLGRLSPGLGRLSPDLGWLSPDLGWLSPDPPLRGGLVGGLGGCESLDKGPDIC
jgi:hypothetical protein